MILNKKLSESSRPHKAKVLHGEEGSRAGGGHRAPVELHPVILGGPALRVAPRLGWI